MVVLDPLLSKTHRRLIFRLTLLQSLHPFPAIILIILSSSMEEWTPHNLTHRSTKSIRSSNTHHKPTMYLKLFKLYKNLPNHKRYTIIMWFHPIMDQERSTLISHKKAANTDLAININNSIINRINMEIWVDRIRTNMDNIRLKELGCKEWQEVPNISNKITIKAVSSNKINILKANSLTVIWRRVFMVAKINNN